MKKLNLFVLSIFALVASTSLMAQGEFITLWKTNPGSGVTDSTSIKIPATGDYVVTWKEVSNPTHNGTATYSGIGSSNHPVINFDSKGIYEVKIAAQDPNTPFGFAFPEGSNTSSDAEKLLDVTQWGNNDWNTFSGMFYGCTFMVVSAIDMPKTGWATSMSNMFYGCHSFVSNDAMANWNVSTISDMGAMFRYASRFNGNINNWNVANVENMGQMFGNAISFNQPLDKWDMTGARQLWQMFYQAESFNQDVSAWDMSHTANLWNMFGNTTAFNQSLGAWTLGSVNEFGAMLDGSGLDCINYTATLVGWANNSETPSGKSLGAQGLHYSDAGQAARNTLINTKGWTVLGDTYSSTCTATSVNTISALEKYSLYPNPAHNYVSIQGLESKIQIAIFDLTGKKVAEQVLSPNEKISLNGLNNGIYFVRLPEGMLKLIVQ